MLKLIKLEWKKNNIGKYIRNACNIGGGSLPVHVRTCLSWYCKRPGYRRTRRSSRQ